MRNISSLLLFICFVLFEVTAADQDGGFELTKNNLIGEIPKLEMEWEMSFDLKPISKPTDGRVVVNIIKVISKTGLQILKLGFTSAKTILKVCTIDNKKCLHDTEELDLGKYHSITVKQYKDSNGVYQLMYRIESDGESRERSRARIQLNPSAYNNVQVLAAAHESTIASARIKNFAFGDYVFSGGKLIEGDKETGFELAKNNQIGEIPKLGMDWEMSFDLKAHAKPKTSTVKNIIKVISKSRLQILKIGFTSAKTILKVCTTGNSGCLHDSEELKLGVFYKITIKQYKDSDGTFKLLFRVSYNGKSREKTTTKIQKNQAAYKDIKIYAAAHENTIASARMKKFKFGGYAFTGGYLVAACGTADCETTNDVLSNDLPQNEEAVRRELSKEENDNNATNSTLNAENLE